MIDLAARVHVLCDGVGHGLGGGLVQRYSRQLLLDRPVLLDLLAELDALVGVIY